ncbi:hypothetical protein [Flaviflexus sp.]|uniref:hypothetical protein n=1 Tax=Flaviflexus sp. TaxID=1969482 RepID=UPI003F939D61
MGPENKDGMDETDWDRYAAELGDAFDGADWPISAVPPAQQAARPRDWVQPELDDEQPEAADDVLDATYEAMGKRPLSTLEKVLLAIVGIGLVLIVLNEVSVLTLSPTLFIVVVIAAAGAGVAWVVAFATGDDGDDGMRV